MFRPDDPLAPPRPAFAEPWRAQALALADALVKAGRVSPRRWAEALGAELAQAEARGEPDNEGTYYQAVLKALEGVMAEIGVSPHEQADRERAWADAYRATPHGQPVALRR